MLEDILEELIIIVDKRNFSGLWGQNFTRVAITTH